MSAFCQENERLRRENFLKKMVDDYDEMLEDLLSLVAEMKLKYAIALKKNN